jgi:RecB family exonuclease
VTPTPLPVVDPPVHPRLRKFATAEHPLRPSKVADVLACPLSYILSMHEEDSNGGVAAQTGNLIHRAVDAFHKTTDREARVAAGVAALEAAREKFPGGDAKKAQKIFTAYAADPENADARVKWVEQAVELTLPADHLDPTGEPIVIRGTMDQGRIGSDGIPRVWDVKTGDYLPPRECLDEHTVQQAVYVLAARKTLHPKFEPGGLIYTPNYEKSRGKRHLPYPMTVQQCEDVIAMLPLVVAAVRRGRAIARPGVDSCRWCDHKSWPRCHGLYRGMF